MSLHHALRAAGSAGPTNDPYFKNTSLLLLGNGSNGGQNNTFTDGSSNAFSVTRYGNTTQGTFSPFGYNWSNYFDGSGDDLRLSSSSAFSLGTGDFTFEAWINPANWTNTAVPFFVVTATGGLWIGKNGSNFVVRAFGVADQLTYSTMPTVGIWTHIVAVRSGTTLSLYYNGSRVATTTNSYSFAQGGLAIGSDADSYSTAYYTGHLSNVRLVKGTAVYDPTQTTLTVPTAPLTAITNTSLLTCQSSRFIDNSSNAFTITPYGDAKVTNFAPFPTNTEYSTGTNGGSGYFDGNGDYLSTANNGALDFGSGDFTVECWNYSTSASSDGIIYLSGLSNGYAGFRLSPTYLLMSTSGSSWLFTDAVWSANINQWNHLAVTRSGSTLRVFLNGSIVVTKTISGSLYASGTQYTIGRYQENGSTYYYYSGYISSLRVLKGTAQYTAAFTPDTAPLGNITNTSLLLGCTNAAIIDSTGKNDIETVGDAQISTSVKKFGTGSIYFDGNGDYLQAPNSTNANFQGGNFTIEFWMYASAQALAPIVHQTSYASSLGWIIWNYDGANVATSTRKLTFMANGVGFTLTTSSDAYSDNTWTHIAIVKNGTGTNNITIYSNGVSVGSGTYATALADATQPLMIGGVINGVSWNQTKYFTGYIDDLRITKSVARYTANFTAPTRQLPAR